MKIPEKATRAIEWWKDSRLGRTLGWYGHKNGSRLCGAIAYSALFSLFGALTIGWTVFSAVVGNNQGMRGALLGQIDEWVPGLVGDGAGYMISPDALILHGGARWAALVAAVVTLMAALGVMGALRSSVRTMFDVPPDCDNAIMARAWSLAGFVLLGLGVLVSAGSSILSRVIQAHVDSWFGGSAASAFAIRGATAIVGVVIDAAIVASIILVVARVVPKSRRDLIVACLAVGVVSAGLRWVGTSVVVGSSAHNALLAPFAVIVTILVLVNFLARLLLYASAWIFDPPRLQRGASSASGVGKQEATDDET